MAGSAGGPVGEVVYCVIPWELSARLHEPLRRHFLGDPGVRVVVERRGHERRSPAERRGAGAGPAIPERRRVRSVRGRRVGERRALVAEIEALDLPRKLARHAGRLMFLERMEPPAGHAEDLDTARLVIAVQAGDLEAFSALYLRYFDRVYSYMRVGLRDLADAEDLTQEVFIKAMGALPAYEVRADKPFRFWLFRVTRNELIDHTRKHDPVHVSDPEEMNRLHEDDGMEAPPVLNWLSDPELVMLVERLPLPQRQVLTLRYLMDLRPEEIAAVLDRSADSVRQLHSRAVRMLQNRLTAIGRHSERSTRREPIVMTLRHANVLRARRFALR